MVRTKRNRLEVIKVILGTILLNRNLRPTGLLYKANLSPQMFKDYTEELIERGLIKKDIYLKGEYFNHKKLKSNRDFFNLTELGRQCLEDYKAVDLFLEKYSLNEEE